MITPLEVWILAHSVFPNRREQIQAREQDFGDGSEALKDKLKSIYDSETTL